MSLKSRVRSLIPPAILARVSRHRQGRGLSSLPPLSFQPQNLRPLGDMDPGHFWGNPDILRSWEGDSARIAALHPYGDLWGGVNPGDRRALYSLVKGLDPKRVLEVGTHIGSSTIHIAAALKANGSGGQLHTVDIYDVNDPVSGAWRKVGAPASPADMLARLGLGGIVTFHADGALDFMKKTAQRFDLVFLDGDHAARTVYAEVAAAMEVLSPSGMILLHDYYPGGLPLFQGDHAIMGPYLAMRRVMGECPCISVLPLGSLPWPTKRGGNATSLALVGRAA